VRRVALILAVALPLAAADLVWKHFATTPEWAYHARGLGWLFLSLALVAGALAVARLPSLVAAIAAGVMAGGVLGNALSAAWNGLRVPDPIIVVARPGVIAFNLADVFTSSGIMALTLALSVALVRNRNLLRARESTTRTFRDRR
jgi:lipoprotein signal peptidase